MEIDTYNILCPYCQNICGNPDDIEDCNPFDEEPIEFECEECGKKFECRRVTTIDYRTEKDCSLNGEECEAGEYHCKKCDSYDLNVKLKLEHDALHESKDDNNVEGEEKDGTQ